MDGRGVAARHRRRGRARGAGAQPHAGVAVRHAGAGGHARSWWRCCPDGWGPGGTDERPGVGDADGRGPVRHAAGGAEGPHAGARVPGGEALRQRGVRVRGVPHGHGPLGGAHGVVPHRPEGAHPHGVRCSPAARRPLPLTEQVDRRARHRQRGPGRGGAAVGGRGGQGRLRHPERVPPERAGLLLPARAQQRDQLLLGRVPGLRLRRAAGAQDGRACRTMRSRPSSRPRRQAKDLEQDTALLGARRW